MGIVRASILVSLATTACGSAFAQTRPKTLPEPDVVATVQDIQQANLLKLSQPLVIDKSYNFDGWFIVADKIIFKSGAKLVFSRQALDKRRIFYVVTKELISEDSASPGTITYDPPPSSGASAVAGQAPSGAPGGSDGASGSPGAPGAKGPDGPKGFTAPSLTLTVLSVPSSGVMIDFSGGVGGQGGKGQKGGDGGAGRQGSPASQSMFDCKAGGGRGGNGGSGGLGGAGGVGGPGGDGGTVKIIAPAGLLPSLTEKFRVVVSGGQPGSPGTPGDGGNPGAAGAGGQEAKPYCGGGSGGSSGSAGSAGVPGQAGVAGLPGDLLVGAITPEQFALINK